MRLLRSIPRFVQTCVPSAAARLHAVHDWRSASYALLYRYTGQRTPRRTPTPTGAEQIDNMIGWWSKASCLRGELGGDPTFLERSGGCGDEHRDRPPSPDRPWRLGQELRPDRHVTEPRFQVISTSTTPGAGPRLRRPQSRVPVLQPSRPRSDLTSRHPRPSSASPRQPSAGTSTPGCLGYNPTSSTAPPWTAWFAATHALACGSDRIPRCGSRAAAAHSGRDTAWCRLATTHGGNPRGLSIARR